MADISINSGWHATDDETPVPVRSSAQAETEPTITTHEEPQQQSAPLQSPRGMSLSAFLGVALVLAALGIYFGIGSLLTGDVGVGSDETTVTITSDGHFSPESVTIRPGESLKLVNENADPQVIKSSNGRDLFPVQVLFADPFAFTIPADAAGAYVYFSETLPDDRTVTINVVEAAASSPSAAVTTPSAAEIPLPFSDIMPPPVRTAPAPAAPVASVEKTEHSSATATISVGGSAPANQNASESSGTATVPVNPYTVASGIVKQTRAEAFAAMAAQESLHSGAPAQKGGGIISPPNRMTDTGPAGMLALILPGLVAVGYVYRKTAH